MSFAKNPSCRFHLDDILPREVQKNYSKTSIGRVANTGMILMDMVVVNL